MEINTIYNGDCIEFMKNLRERVDLLLTDIPYGVVNRDSNGLRDLDKGNADIMTFDLNEFLELAYQVTKSTIIIFCGKEQLSGIYSFFADKQKNKEGTVRQIIYEKTNPSPMNGQYVYLSGVENAVWFKKRGGVFNAHCKNPVFRYPCGSKKFHPTMKHIGLIKELIMDNSNEGDIVFDPCAGSGNHLLAAKECRRNYIGVELNKQYFEIAKGRLAECRIKSENRVANGMM